MSSDSATNPNYFYNPNVPAAIVFAALFGLPLVAHSLLAIRYRTWYMIVLIFAVGMEFVGYITRVLAAKSPYPLWAAIVSQVGLIVAPAFLAAQSYMIIGRVMSYVGNEHSFINHSKITKIFVSADVIAILTQATAGSMLGGNSSASTLNVAKKILLAGLAVQVITFGIFLFVAIAYNVRSSRAPAMKIYDSEMQRLKKLWLAFYISGALITIRSIYRTLEFGSASFTTGNNNPTGYVLSHEWPMYVFDAIPILISVWAFALYHPGHFLPTKKGLRIDGTYEEQKGRRRFLCCGRRKAPRRGPEEAVPLPNMSIS